MKGKSPAKGRNVWSLMRNEYEANVNKKQEQT